MATSESTAMAEAGSAGMDVAVGRLSELPAFNGGDPAMVFMAQIAHRWNMAKMLVKSGMIPQKSPEAAIAVMLKGHELGVTPMVAFANMFFFDGKLGMSADLMSALFIQKAGGRMQVLEWTEKVCRIRFTREGWEPSDVSYTEQDAQVAGLLNKANWKNRKAMLSARCRSMGVRLLAPDVFAGTYSTEELQDMDPEPARRSSPANLERRLRAVAADEDTDSAPDASEPSVATASTSSSSPDAEAEEIQDAHVVEDASDTSSSDGRPQWPEPGPEPAAEKSPLDEALAAVEAIVADIKPAGGDATDPQRARIRACAATLYPDGGQMSERVLALADAPALGKRQAGALIGKLGAATDLKVKSAPAAAPAAPAASADPEDLFR